MTIPLTHIEPVLTVARQAIQRRDDWTHGVMARDGGGNQCSSLSSAARYWCLVGAVQLAVNKLLPATGADPVFVALYDALLELEPGDEWRSVNREAMQDVYCTLTAFNDNRTHEEVLGLLDSAIDRAKT